MNENVTAFPRLRPLFCLETMKFVRLYKLSVFTSATLDSASYKFTSKNSIATLTCSSIESHLLCVFQAIGNKAFCIEGCKKKEEEEEEEDSYAAQGRPYYDLAG